MSESETIKVILADDHNLFRKMLFHLLSDEDDIEVIGEASTGKEALETLFNDHNLIYEYHQIKYSLGAKNHNCFFDIINNKGNKKNINQNDYK